MIPLCYAHADVLTQLSKERKVDTEVWGEEVAKKPEVYREHQVMDKTGQG